MSEVEVQINRINTKLQQLLKSYGILQKENERLSRDIADCRSRHAKNLERVDELNQQVAILKSAAGQMTEEDKSTFEKRINNYIREIDKCIGLLSE